MAALLLNPSISFSSPPSLLFLLNMEVNPNSPPLSLVPWSRISCQSWAADTQLCSNNHTAWTQHMNVCLGVYVRTLVRVHFCESMLWCERAFCSSANLRASLYAFACLSVTEIFTWSQIESVSPPYFKQSNLQRNERLTPENPEATKCTRQWPQQLLSECQGHQHTDP